MAMQVNFDEGNLTPHGKRYVARTLFEKGKSFLRASAHLQREDGYRFVVLHLLCQGTEIILKSFLLYSNYDEYIGQLKEIGHDLERLAKICGKEYKVKVGRQEMIEELAGLNSLYQDHILRYGYGSVRDILVDPRTIPFGLVAWRVNASVRIANHLLGISLPASH